MHAFISFHSIHARYIHNAHSFISFTRDTYITRTCTSCDRADPDGKSNRRIGSPLAPRERSLCRHAETAGVPVSMSEFSMRRERSEPACWETRIDLADTGAGLLATMHRANRVSNDTRRVLDDLARNYTR